MDKAVAWRGVLGWTTGQPQHYGHQWGKSCLTSIITPPVKYTFVFWSACRFKSLCLILLEATLLPLAGCSNRRMFCGALQVVCEGSGTCLNVEHWQVPMQLCFWQMRQIEGSKQSVYTFALLYRGGSDDKAARHRNYIFQRITSTGICGLPDVQSGVKLTHWL